MHANGQLIQRFYAAFARRDATTMAACYAPDAHFTDPVFDLHGPEIGAMWSMLCARAKNLEVTSSGVAADDHSGRAHWEPRYTYSATGRPVHNEIDATFTFAHGKIVTHIDTFDLWRWSRMALGKKGFLLGWMPMARKKIRRQARAGLDAWIARHPLPME